MMLAPIVAAARMRPVQITVGVVVILLLLLGVRRYEYGVGFFDYTNSGLGDESLADSDASATAGLQYLSDVVKQYNLSAEVSWHYRRIKPAPGARERQSLTKASSKLVPNGFQTVQVHEESNRIQVQPLLSLPVTASPTPVHASGAGLLFGISTTVKRIKASQNALVEDWTAWLTDGKGGSNGASLVVMLEAGSRRQVKEINDMLRGRGINAVVYAKDFEIDEVTRYIELVNVLGHRNYELAEKDGQTRFLALVSDELFVPSVDNLRRSLEHLDVTQQVYVTMPSEQSDWIAEKNVVTTYGGGAVVLTPAMAELLSHSPCLDNQSTKDAEKHRGKTTWDEALTQCVMDYTPHPVHVIPSLFHPDDEAYRLRSGYESGVLPLTMNHAKTRHGIVASMAHLVTSVCGEDCFLQRYRFRDDWILVNGHSISQYPDGLGVTPLKSMPKQLMPLAADGRRILVDSRLEIEDLAGRDGRQVVSWRGIKRTWTLLDAKVEANGEVWQAYVKRRGAAELHDEKGESDDHIAGRDGDAGYKEEPSELDSVILLVWEP